MHLLRIPNGSLVPCDGRRRIASGGLRRRRYFGHVTVDINLPDNADACPTVNFCLLALTLDGSYMCVKVIRGEVNCCVARVHIPMFRQKHESGAVVAEAALTIGVLFLFLFAIVEFGRAYNIYQTLTDAAREGARYSVAPDPANSYTDPSASQVQANVQQFMAAANIRGGTVQVSCIYAAGSPAPQTSFCPQGASQSTDSTLQVDNGFNPVYTEVRVSVPYKFVVLPFSVTMSSKAVMRNENN